MKILILILVGMFASLVSIAQSGINAANEAINSTTETATNPDSMIWFIGAVLVVLFIFLVVLALAKGAIAMSETIEINIHNKR